MSAIFPGNRTSFFQSIKPVFLSTDVSGISKKITGNVERDLRQQNELRSLSWNVIVIWECELKKDLFEETMINVEEALKRNISSEGK